MQRPDASPQIIAFLALLLIPLAAFAEEPVLEPATTEAIDLRIDGQITTRGMYQAWADAYGLQVLFAPNLKDSRTTLDLKDVAAEEALGILTRTRGHFYQVLNPKTVFIAEDTPQNRRVYDQQVLQVFTLESAEFKDVMTLIRSLIGAKHIAGSETLNQLIVRDSRAVAEIAAEIIRRVDHAPGEVVVDVEFFHLDESVDFAPGDQPSEEDLRLLRKKGHRFAEQKLRALDKRTVSLRQMKEHTILVDNATASYLEIGFAMEASIRIHPQQKAVTLGIDLTVANGSAKPGEGPVVESKNYQTHVRLADGETFLVRNLPGTDGLFAKSFDLPQEGSIVLALTPRILRAPSWNPEDLKAFCIGTDTALELCE